MSADVPAEGGPTTPFHDLNDYVAIPRVAALQLSPDGSWLAAAVQTLSADRKKYLTSIWRIDTQGGPPRRLTRSAEGEASPHFLPDGSLLFTSRRPDPGASQAPKDESSTDVAALWLLPPGGGEARIVAALPGGVAAAEAVEGLMSLTQIDCNRVMFKRALPFFTDHRKLSFEDCCLATYAELSNAEPLWTFDRKLAGQAQSARLVPI